MIMLIMVTTVALIPYVWSGFMMWPIHMGWVVIHFWTGEQQKLDCMFLPCVIFDLFSLLPPCLWCDDWFVFLFSEEWGSIELYNIKNHLHKVWSKYGQHGINLFPSFYCFAQRCFCICNFIYNFPKKSLCCNNERS